MKVLHEKYYDYIGVVGSWHAFKCTKVGFDPEVILLYRARMIMNDGSDKFFDPVEGPSSFRRYRGKFLQNPMTSLKLDESLTLRA